MLWLNRIFRDRVDAAKQLVEACKKSISCYHLLPSPYLCYHLLPIVTNAQYLNSEYL